MDELERRRLSLKREFGNKLEKLHNDIFGQLEDFKQSFLEQITNWEDQWRLERFAFLEEIARLTELLQQHEIPTLAGNIIGSAETTLTPFRDDRVTSSHNGESYEKNSPEALEPPSGRPAEISGEILQLQSESAPSHKEVGTVEDNLAVPSIVSGADVNLNTASKEIDADLRDRRAVEEEEGDHDPPESGQQPSPSDNIAIALGEMQRVLPSQIDDSQPSIISPSGSHIYITPTRKRYRDGTPTPLNDEDDSSDDHSTVFETPRHDTFIDVPQDTLSPTERAILGPDYSQLKLQERATSFTFDDPLPLQRGLGDLAHLVSPQNSMRAPVHKSPLVADLQPSSSPIGLANIPGIAESYDLDNVVLSGRSYKRRRYNPDKSSSQPLPPSSSPSAPEEEVETAATTAIIMESVAAKPHQPKTLRPPAGIEQDAVLLSSSPSPQIVKVEEPSQTDIGLAKMPMAPPKLPLTRSGAQNVRNKIGGNSIGNRPALQTISANAKMLPEPNTLDKETPLPSGETPSTQNDIVHLKGTVRQRKALTPTAGMLKNRIKGPPLTGSSHTPPSSAPAKTVQTRLQISDFKINPAANPAGLDFAYSDPVRRKADKACIPGCTRECCSGAFRALAEAGLEPPKPKDKLRWSSQDSAATAIAGEAETNADMRLLSTYLDPSADLTSMTPTQRAEMLLQAKANQLSNAYGKHKQQFERHQTPPGFWRTDMPTTQEAEEDRQLAKEMEERRVAERLREAQRSGGRYVLKQK